MTNDSRAGGVASQQPNPVVVVDVQMKFTSMVAFMVKWALASIPALLILIVVGTFIAAFGTAIFGGLARDHVSDAVSSSMNSSPGSVAGYVPPSDEERRQREALTERHNKGWAWAEEHGVKSVAGCVNLGDVEERVGCEVYAKAFGDKN